MQTGKKEEGYLTQREYEYVFKRTPRLCVDLVICTPGGIVLSKRSIPPFQGQWHFPGGRVRHRERLTTALQRIARAEIGCRVSVEHFIGPIEVLRDGPHVHSVSLAYMVTLDAKKVRGSWQGETVHAFKRIPPKMHRYHAAFLRAHPELFKVSGRQARRDAKT